MDDIRAWLNGKRNYEEGARLYLVHGKDHALRRVFNEPKTPYKEKLLPGALKDLLTKKKAVVQKVETAKAVAIEHVAAGDRKWPPERDEVLQALHIQWKPLFAEMMSLMARIYDVALRGRTDPAAKDEAGKMAHRICDLDDECDRIYEKRDHYLKYGNLPADTKLMELVVDPKKIPLALANAERYVRDYKNKLSKEPGNEKHAKMLKKYEWAVAKYKEQLNID